MQCSEFYLCLMMMHLREELSQELFSEDLCDQGYAGKSMSLADTQHQSPDVGASWRPLWEVDHVNPDKISRAKYFCYQWS